MITGRLTKDPVIKYFEKGSCKTTASLAETRYLAGEPKGTNYYEIEAWGKLAERFANYCAKGTTVGIKGEAYLQEWTDKNTGKSRCRPVVYLEELDILSIKKAGQVADEVQTTEDWDDE